MEEHRPLILLTNDDGIRSPGLLAAAEAVADLGELLLSAPIHQQTGMARAFPRTGDLGIIESVELSIGGQPIRGYGVHGSPAYSVS
jgi:5'-nucleotidase